MKYLDITSERRDIIPDLDPQCRNVTFDLSSESRDVVLDLDPQCRNVTFDLSPESCQIILGGMGLAQPVNPVLHLVNP